ncbi:PAS domain-containing protein [candidate division KSB1 bacterium]|nr:PAS domain-containing protein [candidate division KSB1 bacterium]
MTKNDQPSTEPAREQPNSGRTPIVAIGASAGGLEALKSFFSSTPIDSGIAFIVITHIKPHRASMLPEILANATDIPVIRAEEDTEIKVNQIIVAKDSLLNVEKGKLYSEKWDGEQEMTYHPIDHFFRSLAHDQKEHAIGVILSGSGNDGTLGVKEIKSTGGMIMVQDTGTAEYTGMPASAQATGFADYVLPPKEMPAALIAYCRGPFLQRSSKAPMIQLPESAIRSILERLRYHTGHDFTEYKQNTMARRIERRMNVHRIKEPGEYSRFLKENSKELNALFQELLISVTSFFRDPESFVFLAENILPKLLKQLNDGDNLRVWVPGCATGEEAYSLAILLDEQLWKINRLFEIQIFATDLDHKAIETARSGLYPQGITADVSAERLNRYFSQEDGSFRIHKNIRDMIVFAVQNLISDPPFTRMNLIACRNVLIYLDHDAQQRVLPTLHYALQPGGVMVLGSSESLGESGDMFEIIDHKHKIFRKKDKPGHVYQPHPLPGRDLKSSEAGVDQTFPLNRRKAHLSRIIQSLLMERFVPAAAIIDDTHKIIYLQGRTGLYFEPEQGEPKNNILEMAREGLRPALRAGIQQSQKEMIRVEKKDIKVKTNGEHIHVNVSIEALSTPKVLRGMILITLVQSSVESTNSSKKTKKQGPRDPSALDEMERELAYTKENLQSTIEELETSNEELRSSNEELQSTNEELQSTNEELETSKEEMQSLNEELNTVNSELESKVRALARTNDDMNNLLNAMQIATIFLDSELKVKRYTKQAKDVIRLIETDIGRPLSDLTSTIPYDELTRDCEHVLNNLATKETEIRDKNGHWFQVKIMPYRTVNNVIDGVVVSFINIDRLKRIEAEKDTAILAKDLFLGIIETLREPLMVLDKNQKVVIVNSIWYKTFRTHEEETKGKYIYELGNGQWDHPDLRNLLENILSTNSVMTDFKISQKFPYIGHRTFLLNARKLENEQNEPNLILLVFKDVTKETH